MDGQTTAFDTAKNEGYINGVKYLDHNEYLKQPGAIKSGGNSEWFPSFSDLGPSATEYGKTLDASENKAFGQYAETAMGQDKPIDIYNKLEAAKGLPQLREQATSFRNQLYGLEDAINRTEGNVNATTTNSLVTEGQRQNMITERKQPLLNTYTPLATAYGRVQEGISAATQSVDKLTSLILQGQEKELGVMETGLQLTISQNARAMTGFNMDKQTKLDLLLEKLHRTQALDDREWAAAQTLAAEERDYTTYVKKLAEEAKYSTGGNKFDYQKVGSNLLQFDSNGNLVSTYGGGGGAGTGDSKKYYDEDGEWEEVQ